MDEARALFLSLPSAAQTYVRAALGDKGSVNLRKVSRAVYPYVQSLEDAQGIAQFLAAEETAYLDCPVQPAKACVLSKDLREIRTLREYLVLKDKCDACAAGCVEVRRV
jgi:hypothetical protein